MPHSLLSNRRFMARLIPSKTVRRNLGDWDPTDLELATLIARMNVSDSIKWYYIRSILEESDPELAQQIYDYNYYKTRVYDDFMSSDPDYIYVVETKRPSRAYFREVEEAVEWGTKDTWHSSFRILKCPLVSSGEYTIWPLRGPIPGLLEGRFGWINVAGDGRSDDLCTSATFDHDGKIMGLYEPILFDYLPEYEGGPSLTGKQVARITCDKTRYPNAYVELPNPFQRGDIVSLVDRPWVCGVVVTSQEEWKDFNDRQKAGEYKDYDDLAVTVAYFSVTEGVVTKRVSPLMLEKEGRARKDIDTPWELLRAGRSLVLGQSAWEEFCAVRERLMKEEKHFPWEEPPCLEDLNNQRETEIEDEE